MKLYDIYSLEWLLMSYPAYHISVFVLLGSSIYIMWCMVFHRILRSNPKYIDIYILSDLNVLVWEGLVSTWNVPCYGTIH